MIDTPLPHQPSKKPKGALSVVAASEHTHTSSMPTSEPASRKSRLCRDIKSLEPTFEASQRFYMATWNLVDACLKQKIVDVTDQTNTVPKKLAEFNEASRSHPHTLKLNVSAPRGGEDGEKLAKRLKDVSHVRDLKSQNYTADFEHGAYVNPDSLERTGLCARNRLNGALRDHSNAVAIVSKSTPTKASNLQISRIPIASVATSDISYQMTTLLITGLANSLASVELGSQLRNPMASGAVTGIGVRGMQCTGGLFVMSHPSRELLEDSPRFLTSQSLLQKARALARAEIEKSEISRVVSQTTDHLRFTCFRIVPDDTASDGSRIWFAFSLVSYLAVDARLHTILEKWEFTEYDLALSHSMLNYAKRLVGNRSRDAISKMEKLTCESAKRTLELSEGGFNQMWKSSSARFVDEEGSEDEDDELDTESVVSASTASVGSSTMVVVKLSDIAQATRVACTHELARKSRRIDTEPATPKSGSCMGREPSKSHPKARAVVASGMSGAPRVKATLEFLHLHFSQNDGLLLHLYADTEEASIHASRNVLKAQLESKNINKDLHNTLTESLENASRSSAIQTRRNVEMVCDQASCRSPAISVWVETSPGGGGKAVCAGLIKRPQMDDGGNASSTTLVSCCLPDVAQPDEARKTSVVWCLSSCTTRCFEETSKGMGGAIQAFRDLSFTERSGSAANKRLLSQQQHRVQRVASKAFGPGENGIARSKLVFEASVPVNSEVLATAFGVAEQIVKAHAETCASSHAPLGTRLLDQATPTPGVTPSNVFTVGMYLLECSRTSLNQIAPKQGLLAVPIAPDSTPSSIESKEVKRVNPPTRPWAFLSVNDVAFEASDPHRLHRRLEQDAADEAEGCAPPTHVRQLGLATTVTVTGDSAMDVPTALQHLTGMLLSRQDVAGRLSLLRQWRSVCYASGIQCSTFHQFSNSVSAREMNTKIEGTSKVDAPDNNYLCFPTIAQCYVVGHCNLPIMFEGSPWMDTYGAGYECGAIASVGINGRMIVSDQRNAAFALMDQTQVDTLCERLARRSVVVASDRKSFLRVPTAELGGLPRQMIPGVHLALTALEAAFNNLPSSEACEDMRKSIQVLPFSPFSQAVPSNVVSESLGMDFRDKARTQSGRGAPDPPSSTEHPRPLRTLKKQSILGSEFMQPACIKMVSLNADNVFETIEPAVAPLLVFASQIGEIAKLVAAVSGVEPAGVAGAAELSCLRRVATSFFNGGVVGDVCLPGLVIDALVLFNAMFPMEFEVGKSCIIASLASAPSAFFARPESSSSFVEMQLDGVTTEEREELIRFQRRLLDDSEQGPWNRISDFVCMVCDNGSRFDNSEKDMQQCARITATLGEIVWLLHSDDGVTPPAKWSPLHCRANPKDVCAMDLVCVWTDRPETSAANRKAQRGALIGLPNAGPQQMLMLLTGAFLPGCVKVQYARNEGNMCLRMSSCALKETSSSRLTAKSTSPIYSDNDAESFGTLEAKEAQARRQVVAWRANNDLIFEVSTQFDFPRSERARYAGSNFIFKQIRDSLARFEATGRTSTEEVGGAALMKKACSA